MVRKKIFYMTAKQQSEKKKKKEVSESAEFCDNSRNATGSWIVAGRKTDKKIKRLISGIRYCIIEEDFVA
jgi:hypothetical protein